MLLIEDKHTKPTNKCLTTADEVRSLLQDYGPQFILPHLVNPSENCMEPEEFIEEILLEKMGAQIVVAGSDCRFGKNGRGNAKQLEKYAETRGFQALIIDPVRQDDTIITSEIIREDLLSGNLAQANRRLGYPYTLRGEVVRDNVAGKVSRIPTIKLETHPSKLIPAHGVYATITKVDDKYFLGLTKIGQSPTVDDSPDVTIETFLLDFEQDISGKTVETQLNYYVREIRKFNSQDEVRTQIDKDMEQVRNNFRINESA